VGPEVAEALNLARTRYSVSVTPWATRLVCPLDGGLKPTKAPQAAGNPRLARLHPPQWRSWFERTAGRVQSPDGEVSRVPGRENPGENLSSARIVIL